MPELPIRGAGVRELPVPLPPNHLPSWRGWRPLKRWRYVGVYTPELLPGGELRERTTFGNGGVAIEGSTVRVEAKGVRIELLLEESPGMEIVSPVDERGAYIWTRKQACVPVSGSVDVDGTRHAIDGQVGFIDDSAGYHPRHTVWKWSAGVGTAVDGRRVGWNLVSGIHDDPAVSERTLWIDGETRHVGPVTFADDLSTVAGDGVDLRFEEWSRREHSTNALIMSSAYSQPFGTFSGRLPGAIELAEGFGVMEDHDVRW